jgi:hypothetical protein
MDAALYDEFGNYIGPELDASDSDGDRESDGEVRQRTCVRARECARLGVWFGLRELT